MRKQFVCATIEVTGTHQWPAAPERQEFLRLPHRHTFCIKGWALVQHGDREVECFDLADFMRASLQAKFGNASGLEVQFGSMSCEHIAEWLCNACNLARCEVMEDGKQGAEVWTGGSE